MFEGSIVALVTPMRTDGAIDWPAFDRLLEFHVRERTDGIVVAGTTGESPVLSVEEAAELVRRGKEVLRGRMPVIAGSGSNSTQRTIELSIAMQRAGADALLVVTPYYNRPPQEGMYRHFVAVADAVSAPVILYNVPSRTGVDLLPETVGRLSHHHPRIVAIKEATGIVSRAREILATAAPGFSVLSGDDPTVVDLIEAGARGVISVTGNVVPRRMHELCKAALGGDFSEAREIDARLRDLHKALFIEPNPIPVKWALARLGLIADTLRLPLVELSANGQQPLRLALQEAGVAFA